jgi:outer membrane biosynthesis protein TonB
MRIIASIAVAIFLAAGVLAQERSVTAELDFTDGVDRKVVSLPMPEYPQEALVAGLSGLVSVAVTTDEKGNILSVDDARGPYPVCQAVTDPHVLVLRQAAIDAAKKAVITSSLTVTPGPVVFHGRIVYKFDAYPKPEKQDAGVAVRLGTSDSVSSSKPAVRYEMVPDKPGSDGSTRSKTISGGVLNGTAMSLPKPAYPPAARAVRASGAVSIQVLILEDGTVYAARALSGHPLLRAASEIAACGSRYTPTLLLGQPVKVFGVITYNFVP